MSKILVVEDEAIICADIERTLRRLGYDVTATADNSDDALRAVETNGPDLVLMDIKLRSAVDGIDTVGRIRRISDVPVVYLTSHSDETTLNRAKETGPHGYLVKPFNERDLRTAIEVALRKHEFEVQLAHRERWFSTTLKSLGDAVIASDAAERITFMNPVAQKLTGFNIEEAIGRPVREVFHIVDGGGGEGLSSVARALPTDFAVTVARGTQLVDKDGTPHEIDDTATPIIDDRGMLLGGVVVFRDITERKRLEKRLEIAERLASLGTMAAGIAHEVNNPLTIIGANVSYVIAEMRRVQASLDRTPDGETLFETMSLWLEALGDAEEGTDRVQKIVATMRRFARPGLTHKEVLDLPAVIDPALKLAKSAIRHRAKLVLAYGTTPLIEADEGQLVQVFLNLLSNAVDAIPEGRSEQNEIRIRTYTDESGRAVAEVHDTGAGIAPQHVARIFDPFYSRKDVGGGMGLGLSICHSFVIAHRGELTVESHVGRGTVFRVTLPAATLPENRTLPPRPLSVPPPPRARVLVIDDDAAVTVALARTLRDHDVVTENDPRAALARIEAGEHFDVIFCDMMMPVMSGADLYDAVHSRHPAFAARFVFITGGALSPRTSSFLATNTNKLLTKPFTAPEIQKAVAEKMHEQPTA